MFRPAFGFCMLRMLMEICFFCLKVVSNGPFLSFLCNRTLKPQPGFGCKLKKHVFAKFCFNFLVFSCFFTPKTRKNHISTRATSTQHPKAGQNIKHLSPPNPPGLARSYLRVKKTKILLLYQKWGLFKIV